MDTLPHTVLLGLLQASAEPVVLVQVDSPDWPIVLANPAFCALAGEQDLIGQSIPDILEPMIGREMAREAGSALRSLVAATLPVDVGSREFLLELVPLGDEGTAGFMAAYLRTAGRQLARPSGSDSFRALVRATRRMRDLSGADAVTGLMNERAFRDILAHDWAVASREDSVIGLTAFRFDDFDDYLHVFGRHGADACLRRVAVIIRRCLRRASDVAARLDGPGGGWIVALTHGANEAALDDFAAGIATAVRDLRLHHPRSSVEKFVTVSVRSECFRPRQGRPTAAECLGRLVSV